MSKRLIQLPVVIDDGGKTLGRFALSQSVLDHSPIGMAITTADDHVIWVNAAMNDDILGISRAHLDDRPFLSFVHPDHQAGVAEDTARLLCGEVAPPAREVRWIAPDGSTRWVSVRTSIATSESGQPLLHGDPALPCLIRQLLDITQRKSVESELALVLKQLQARNTELERSNEELTQFAYVASHDLSEPLRVIAGHVELFSQR
jgi:PAS domain S-box-containing protein